MESNLTVDNRRARLHEVLRRRWCSSDHHFRVLTCTRRRGADRSLQGDPPGNARAAPPARREKHTPASVTLNLDEAFRVLEALEDGLDTLRRAQLAPGFQDELVTVIRMLHGKLGLDEGGAP